MITATKPPPVEAKPHISVSQLKTYGTCPLQWRYSRTYKPEQVGSALKFGSAFHRAVAAHLQARLEGSTLTREELLDAFDVGWNAEDADVPIKFNKSETSDGLRALAGMMLDAFTAAGQPGKTLAIEMPFSCRLAPDLPVLVGYIDAISVEDNVLVVTDYKTAARRPSEDPDDLDPAQLLAYGIGLAKIGFLREFAKLPLRLQYTFITKSKSQPEVITIPLRPSRRDADRLIERTRIISKAMAQEIVYPNPGYHCASCGHQARCRRWPRMDTVSGGTST